MEATHTIKSSAIAGTIYRVGDSPFWQFKFYHPSDRKRKRVSLGTEDLINDSLSTALLNHFDNICICKQCAGDHRRFPIAIGC